MITETSENVMAFIDKCHKEDDIHERIQEKKNDYVDECDLEDFDGDVDAAYDERGRNEAENHVYRQILTQVYVKFGFTEDEFYDDENEDFAEDVRSYFSDEYGQL